MSGVTYERMACFAAEEFQRAYPDVRIGKAHKTFIERNEITIIELRAESGERRRFSVAIFDRVNPLPRLLCAILEDGEFRSLGFL
jgi:hypothetical protein